MMHVRSALKRYALGVVTGLFILISAGHIYRLSLTQKELHVDEVWSVWQLLGSQTDYTRDTTWPPVYYIALDVWRNLVGINPVVLRYFSFLMFLVGLACVYRVMRRLSNEAAAWLGMLAYSALALSIYLSLVVRGYTLVSALLPLAFWLTLRYFDHPGWKRGVALAVVMVVMFYTAYGAMGAFLMLALYTGCVYPRRIWRWWLPGLVFGFMALPALLKIWSFAVGRIAPLGTLQLPPFTQAMIGTYSNATGNSSFVWLLLVGLAALMILLRQRPLQIKTFALLLWGASEVLMYLTNRYLGLYGVTYGWFIMLGAMLWIAWGLSFLPRPAQFGAAAILIVLMITPVPYTSFEAEPPPIGHSLQDLAHSAQWGDVLVIDPNWKDLYCQCTEPEVFDYMIKLYFPQGFQIVTNPAGYRRVWYLKVDGHQDADFEKSVVQGRLASKFIGPPEALFRLYEAPPDPVGILFANGMRFHGAEVLDQNPGPLVRRVMDTIHLRLWWSVDRPPQLDYSISVSVLYDGQIAIQSDSGPQLVDSTLPKATSQWTPGQYYIEDRDLFVPRGFTTGAYPVYLAVYQWWDQTRIVAPGANPDHQLTIDTLHIKAW
jgi:hypothetical protein